MTCTKKIYWLQARLKKWRLCSNDLYCLYGNESETVQHLFFDCLFSRLVRQNIFTRRQIQRGSLPWRREGFFGKQRQRVSSLEFD